MSAGRPSIWCRTYASPFTIPLFFLIFVISACVDGVGELQCGSECKGQCFSGICLFVPDDLNNDISPSAQEVKLSRLVQPSAALASSPSASRGNGFLQQPQKFPMQPQVTVGAFQVPPHTYRERGQTLSSYDDTVPMQSPPTARQDRFATGALADSSARWFERSTGSPVGLGSAYLQNDASLVKHADVVFTQNIEPRSHSFPADKDIEPNWGSATAAAFNGFGNHMVESQTNIPRKQDSFRSSFGTPFGISSYSVPYNVFSTGLYQQQRQLDNHQLQQQLNDAHRLGKALNSENLELRQELVSWHRTASQIINREAVVAAQVAKLRKESSTGDQQLNSKHGEGNQRTGLSMIIQRSPSAPAVSQLPEATQSYQVPSIHLSNAAFALIMVFFGVNAISFAAWHIFARSRQEQDDAAVPKSLKASSAAAQMFWGKRSGEQEDRTFDISGIRVGNLNSDRAVYVSFQLGDGDEMSSRQGSGDGSAQWSFTDTFLLEIAKPRGRCTCRVYEEDEEIARLEIPVADLSRISQTKGYFTMDLVERLPRTRQHPARVAPYIAAKVKENATP